MPQCVSAAHQTLAPGFQLHSVKTHFLRAGNISTAVTYRVDDLSDGKTFATRQVKVEQDGETIAMTIIGFAKKASVAGLGTAIVSHAERPVAMPAEAPTEECDEIQYTRGDSNVTIKGYTLPIVIAKGVYLSACQAGTCRAES